MSSEYDYKGLQKRIQELEEKLGKLFEETDARRRYEFIANAADQFVTVINQEHVYENVNQAYCRARKQKPSDIIGKSVAEIWGADKYETIIKSFLDQCFEGDVVSTEDWFPFADGKSRYHQITYYPYRGMSHEVTHVVVITHDITVRKIAEDELKKAHDQLEERVQTRTAQLLTANQHLKKEIVERKQTEEELRRYEQIVARSNDLMSLIDANFTYQAVNASYLSAYGAKRNDVIGSHVKNLVGEDIFESYFRDRLNQCLRGEEIHYRHWFDFPKLGRRYMDVACYPFINRVGEITGVVANSRDITEIKTLEKRLLQAHKMEAVGTLAGGVAHDFNNLLMGIQGQITLLYMDLPETPGIQESLESIERLIESGAKLTRQLLGFARGGKYVAKPANLNEIVAKTAEMFGRTHRTIRIQNTFQENIWLVEADHGQIEQVLLNLFLNASQAMDGAGELTLRTCNVFLDQGFTSIYEVKPGNYVEVAVTDTGKGMDASIRNRIFEPFFTTREIGGGTGMGLASAFGIVKNHGGYIECDSAPGKGSTFRIYLPVPKKVIGRSISMVKGLERGTETILLVDDEAFILKICTKLLHQLGYHVITADSGPKAIEVYITNKDKIDLVILDMIMPQMSGGEVARNIRSIIPDARILISSGYNLDEDGTEAVAEANGYIQKPFKLQQLSTVIRSILPRKTSQ